MEPASSKPMCVMLPCSGCPACRTQPAAPPPSQGPVLIAPIVAVETAPPAAAAAAAAEAALPPPPQKRGGNKGTRTTSRFRGVCLNKTSNRWRAVIHESGKQKGLGQYDSELAAARAYDAEAFRRHGGCAKLNFPGPGQQQARAQGMGPAAKAIAKPPAGGQRRRRKGVAGGAAQPAAAAAASVGECVLLPCSGCPACRAQKAAAAAAAAAAVAAEARRAEGAAALPALAEGWERQTDPATGLEYYWHKETKAAQWKPPLPGQQWENGS